MRFPNVLHLAYRILLTHYLNYTKYNIISPEIRYPDIKSNFTSNSYSPMQNNFSNVRPWEYSYSSLNRYLIGRLSDVYSNHKIDIAELSCVSTFSSQFGIKWHILLSVTLHLPSQIQNQLSCPLLTCSNAHGSVNSWSGNLTFMHHVNAWQFLTTITQNCIIYNNNNNNNAISITLRLFTYQIITQIDHRIFQLFLRFYASHHLLQNFK